MKIAIVSDIHDHTNHLLSAVVTAKELGCERMIFLGDMAHLRSFITLREEWSGPLDLVFGNNEYEWDEFMRYAETAPDTTLHGEYGELELDGRRIFFCHLPSDVLRASASGRYDVIFYGHTHDARCEYHDGVLLANPGEVQGRQSVPSIGVYETRTGQFLHYQI